MDDKELVKYIYADSKLAVALDFLGIINLEDFPDEHNYISYRGGLLLVHPYKVTNNTLDIATLTVRELIDLLPDGRDDHSYSDINPIYHDHQPVCND